MGDSKRRRIKWTESACLQLVEAVIKVESDEINSSPSIYPKQDKWTRVANQLPVAFRAKSCCKSSEQTFLPGNYKCAGTFFNLVRSYHDKLAGKTTGYARRTMTEAMWALMKRREDLLKARNPTSAHENRKSKLHVSERVTDHRFAHDQRHHTQERKKRKSKGGKAKGMIQWTEKDRLQVIEAVIHIEKDDTRNNNMSRKQKWERIVRLLPRELRERTWNSRRQAFNLYKCRTMFKRILKAYRAPDRAVTQRRSPSVSLKDRLLTKSVCEMLQKREALLKARTPIRVENNFKAGGFGSLRTRSNGSENESRSTSVGAEKDQHTVEQRHLQSEERSRSTSTPPPATFLSKEHTNQSENIAEGLSGFHKNAAESSMQTNNSGPNSPRCASRSFSKLNDPESPTNTARSTQGWAGSKSMISPPKGNANLNNLASRVGVQTRSQTAGRKRKYYSCARPSSRACIQSSGSARGRARYSMAHTGRHNTNLNALMDGPGRRVNLSECSRLSARMKRQAVPLGRKMMHEMTSSAIKSYVRRHLNVSHYREGMIAAKHYELIQRSFSRTIGCRIFNAAHRFAADLENTSMDLGQEIVQEFYSYRSSNDG